MKRALKINLSGRIFHIDEDAYEKLKNYLDTIGRHFSNKQESREILDDIETRIAEILNEKISDSSQVINISQVEEVIEIMGKPEEIVDEEGVTEEGSRDGYYRDKNYRRLYRDPDNAVFGGVAAGISAYFSIDILLVRILFVVFTLIGWGFPIVLYLVLWIAIPKAITAAEKLEMRGEKVNVSNLEKKIREEYEDVKENIKKARSSKSGQRAEDAFHEIFRVLGVILLGFLKIILALIAVGFVIAGISLIASLLGFAFFGAGVGSWGIFHLWGTDMHQVIVPFIDPLHLSLIGVTGILVVLIPVLAIIYGLFKALFRFKARDRALGLAAFALWMVSLITVVYLGISEARNFKTEEAVFSSVTIEGISSDTLFISLNSFNLTEFEDKEKFGLDEKRYLIGEDGKVYGSVEIDIQEADGETYEMEVRKGSRGEDYFEARKFAENLDYEFKMEGGKLFLNPYFQSEFENKWRFQTVDVTIYVPEGKAISFEKDVAEHIDYLQNENHYSPWKMAGKVWIMKEGTFSR